MCVVLSEAPKQARCERYTKEEKYDIYIEKNKASKHRKKSEKREKEKEIEKEYVHRYKGVKSL